MEQRRIIHAEELNNDAIVARIDVSRLNGAALANFLKQELFELLESHPRVVVVDFQNVKAISSTSIGSLLDVVKRTPRSVTRLRLCSLSPQLRAIFKALNLEGTVFEIFESAADALANLSFFPEGGHQSPTYEDDDAS